MRFITLICCFLMASVVFAKDMKVGTVDLQKLFKEYPGTKSALKQFTKMAERKKRDLTDSAQELEDLMKEIKSSGSVISAKQRKQKENEYQAKKEAFAQQEAQIQTELAGKENEMTQTILEEIKVIVAGVAKDKGVDLVLDSEKTVYVNGGVDLTEAVLKNYKKVDADSAEDIQPKKK